MWQNGRILRGKRSFVRRGWGLAGLRSERLLVRDVLCPNSWIWRMAPRPSGHFDELNMYSGVLYGLGMGVIAPCMLLHSGQLLDEKRAGGFPNFERTNVEWRGD